METCCSDCSSDASTVDTQPGQSRRILEQEITLQDEIEMAIVIIVDTTTGHELWDICR
jgi:hypothetical protein